MNNKLLQIAEYLRLGVALYHLYYIPKGFLRECRHKGLMNMAVNFQAQLQMEKAAYRLETLYKGTSVSPLEIHFLTGKNFWYQTCFCAYSMAQCTNITLRPVIYDDGSALLYLE